MKTLQLTRFAKARIWFGGATLGFASSGSVRQHVTSNDQARFAAAKVTLEALVPRGARAEYGLLGLSFDARSTTTLDVEVEYSDGNQAPWLDSLARQIDDVQLGLPHEYATSVLETAASIATHRFPPGRLETVEAAHGAVGSSADFFRRLTVGVLSLMHIGSSPDEELATLLKGILID
jgi:hypothetical protein